MTPVTIESLDQEGRGVAHFEGKVIFIEGALPGEVVTYNSYRKKPSFEFAQVGQILKQGAGRVTPQCPYFGLCGGCSMQHLDARAQVAAKQRILEDNLKHIAKVAPEMILPAIHGEAWGYRQRARLSVRHVFKKNKVLVGFHERKSRYVADMGSCEILPPRISALLLPLGELIARLSISDRVAQVEVSLGEAVDVLVLRNLAALAEPDESLLKAFADRHRIQFYLQPKGPDTAYPFYPLDAAQLNYTLPEFDLTLPFHPTEFTQVNALMNRVLVRRAMQLLDPQAGERIADFFCGLGNFTLPIARSGASVVGYEDSGALVKRAADNAARNNLSANTNFLEKNLFAATHEWLTKQGHFDKILIDPPRDGALELVKSLGNTDSPLSRKRERVGEREGREETPSRIVYISCNPATLARDAGVLVHTQGYHLSAAGVVNMFPHTAHVESVALFER